MWVLFSFFSKPNVSRDNIYRSGTSIVERKILFRKFKKKNLRKNPFPTALNHFPRSQPIPNYNRSKSIYAKKMQKNQVILINHPTQPAFSPIPTFPNQRYPKAAFPNSPTCLNLSRSPTHRTTNQKIPKYHNLLDSKPTQTLSLSPSQPTSTSNPTSSTSKKTSSTRGDKRCPRILLSNVFKLTSN